MRKSLLVVSAALIAGVSFGQGAGLNWYKGNTHTHTTMSDGDSSPCIVARWYRNNGYDFLFITDHNKLTDVTDLQSEISAENEQAQRKPFLLIPGEEVTGNLNLNRKYAVHTAGLDTKTTIGQPQAESIRAMLQESVDKIIAAGGMPSVNHPNFLWSLTADDLYGIKNLKHFEIYNGHPQVNDAGGGDSPSTEEIWDDLLTRGKNCYGVAVDDAHVFKRFGRDVSNPGRGWVVVRASLLTSENVMAALQFGDFYASTGVELDELSTTAGKGMALVIRAHRNEKFRTQFIGQSGQVLKTDTSMNPSYELQEGDLYVRAKVTGSTGNHAWTQPVYLVEPPEEDETAETAAASLHDHPHPHETRSSP